MTLEHEHILSELDNGHPATSRNVDGTDDLHVSLRNLVCTDSPIGVPPIALPQAKIKEFVDGSGDVFHKSGKCDSVP